MNLIDYEVIPYSKIPTEEAPEPVDLFDEDGEPIDEDDEFSCYR